jgi:hypothetical protein
MKSCWGHDILLDAGAAAEPDCAPLLLGAVVEFADGVLDIDVQRQTSRVGSASRFSFTDCGIIKKLSISLDRSYAEARTDA